MSDLDAERRAADADGGRSMFRDMIAKTEADLRDVCRHRDAMEMKQKADKPKLKALWEAAEAVRAPLRRGDVPAPEKVDALVSALSAAAAACDSDDIPF
jgi:hypothetical protein